MTSRILIGQRSEDAVGIQNGKDPDFADLKFVHENGKKNGPAWGPSFLLMAEWRESNSANLPG